MIAKSVTDAIGWDTEWKPLYFPVLVQRIRDPMYETFWVEKNTNLQSGNGIKKRIELTK